MANEKTAIKIAIILIRNTTRAPFAIRDTLAMLNIDRKFTLTMVSKNDTMMGMLDKVKDYVTFGEIDEETHKLLVEKRGQKDPAGKIKKHFHLSPPRGGFERKGIKQGFENGGALGYRGNKINALIKRML
jgi:large subunit ribosomal protein L30